MKFKKLFKNVKGSKKVPELTLYFKQSLVDSKPIESVQDRIDFLRKLFDPGTFELREELILVVLDSMNRPIAYYFLSKGALDSVDIDYLLLFKILFCTGASSFFIAHNHPTKIPYASYQDIESAHDIRMKARYFGFEMADDIVIGSLKEKKGNPGYYSIAERGQFYD